MIKLKISSSIIIVALALSFTTIKNKSFIPPGTAQITETFFADETEISNFSWQEYEFWIKNKYGSLSQEHISALPDTLVWREKTTTNEPYVKYYYRHLAYRDYPVVGISHEQAIAFCKWRTERVKEYWYIKNKKEITLEYRLPTKEEWELISNHGKEFFLNGGKNKKGEVMFNHRWMTDSIWKKYFEEHNKYPDVTAPTYSFWKNNFGLYNTFGNVAEMINEKGVSKGGSWRNLLEECRAGKEISYTEPTAWLGFRCVCVVTK
ncbi:MAG: SUMF1/EgtB/PvdO family nonheme iron enzyme [Bacteroidota bacterium]|nr:SUMF1/EgtB/PvdO family nonheme iron enzyme [Bacteroidota bacterium]MDP3145891.1 SUMF1/EgtB/PvdO family nonheme iron enzyme [Bacteroidota bacterium]MDP3558525.1 SUMF1/EgtB/PvdO family nonheme iron enzyme [Bacteroidota bacterium]